MNTMKLCIPSLKYPGEPTRLKILLAVLVLGWAAVATPQAADWPGWRGPARNGISPETGLSWAWTADGPKVLWKASLGKGFSSFAVAKGRVYSMGNRAEVDTIFCLDAETGKEVWKHSYPCPLDPKAYEGGPLATPAVDGDRVYTISKFGDCFCLDAQTGRVIWSKKFEPPPITKADYHVWWGFAGSIVVAGDQLILPVGTAGVAVDKLTGKVLWDNGPGFSGYSTPVLFDNGPQACFAFVSGHEIVAAEVKTGQVLWKIPWKTTWDQNASDVIISEGKMFVSTGHGVGCALFDISTGKPVPVWRNKNMRTYLSTCILWKGFLYGFDDKQMSCLDWKTGEVQWSIPDTGLGTLVLADGKLIALTEKGTLLVAAATGEAYQPLGQAQILGGRCWSAPVLADGRVFARNAAGDVVCIDARPEAARADRATATVVYQNDASIFPNPERGFYEHIQPAGGGTPGNQEIPHSPLVVAELRALRGSYESVTLLRDCILIPRKFWTEPISQGYLDEIQRNFDAVRQAGIKVVPRFLYDWGMLNRDPDEAVINSHLEQLAPLLRRNADIIAWVQAGLYGGTGEACLSDHGYVYLDANSDGWQRLSAAGRRIYEKELSLIPADRMMTIRYPRLKWDMLGEDRAGAKPLTIADAFCGTVRARIGYYSDGFMGNENSYAMYVLPNERKYTEADTEFVIQEGEISDATEWKLRPGLVASEMRKLHQTALNRGGDGWSKISVAWKRNGDYDEITKRMGYRFRLVSAEFPKVLRPGSACEVKIEMANDGFTRIMNPRDVEMILRGRATFCVRLDDGRGNRLWLPGPGETKTLAIVAGLPNSMLPGEYEVLLNLPDPHPSLAGRPDYSIRLANDKVWEADSGFNRLLHKVRIDPSAGGQPYQGTLRFAPRPAGAATYYVDSAKGSDQNAGTSAEQAWKSLDKVNRTIFSPGDQILFKAGNRWTGQLKPHGSGKAGSPIVIDQFGSGEKPRIDAEGAHVEAVLLMNVEYWEVNNLEITNTGKEVLSGRTGVLVSLDNFGIAHGIKLRNLFVHDVNGDNRVRQRGGFGIHWSAKGENHFDGLLVEGCHLLRTDCNGIWGDGSKTYHQNVVIRNNLLEDIGGDGIVVLSCDKALIEHNRLHKGRQRVLTSCAGIWPYRCDGTVIQFNEVSGMKGFEDGMSFDVDDFCHNTVFQYNYSHDNDGGFLLVMPHTNGTVVRYNISQNDGNGSRIIHFTRPVETLEVYNNIFYVGPGMTTQLIQYGPKSFDSPGVSFANNIFYVDGSVSIERLILEKKMNPDGTYPSEMVIEESAERAFRNNIFFPPSNFKNRPQDPSNKTFNPGLVSPGSGKDDIKSLSGYRLKLDSPCIGAGLFIKENGGRDFWGDALPSSGSPDIGACQRLQ